jgi:epoxyqueuosine reductase
MLEDGSPNEHLSTGQPSRDGMSMQDLNTLIIDAVTGIAQTGTKRMEYRQPLVGFARAADPLFMGLKTLIAPDHLLPSDLLPTAQSVVSFFLPFTEPLVRRNQEGTATTREWAVAKKETDETIQAVIQGVKDRLSHLGIACSDNPALEPYDPSRFIHSWSQRHVAYICGLGNFGLNQLIITERGCAGRLGSFCIAAPTAPSPVCTEEVCPYKVDGSCGVCVGQCPSGALGHRSIDKPACSAWINEFTEREFGGDRVYRSCGKCIALPCAMRRPARSSRIH